jgi:hypothetical protein
MTSVLEDKIILNWSRNKGLSRILTVVDGESACQFVLKYRTDELRGQKCFEQTYEFMK